MHVHYGCNCKDCTISYQYGKPVSSAEIENAQLKAQLKAALDDAEYWKRRWSGLVRNYRSAGHMVEHYC